MGHHQVLAARAADDGFAPFLATLRACLRNAGGVRIDHAMGLQRLWLVPEGASRRGWRVSALSAVGLLRLLALESQRHQAVVVGEDLGTVPEGFREALERARHSGHARAVVREGRGRVHRRRSDGTATRWR